MAKGRLNDDLIGAGVVGLNGGHNERMHAKGRVDPRARPILDLSAIVVPSDPALGQIIDLELEFDRLASSAL